MAIKYSHVKKMKGRSGKQNKNLLCCKKIESLDSMKKNFMFGCPKITITKENTFFLIRNENQINLSILFFFNMILMTFYGNFLLNDH